MPMFCYTRAAKTIERPFPMGRAPKFVKYRGKRYARNIAAEWEGRRDNDACWPKLSDALGVLHSQIAEAGDHLAECGVPTQFANDGTGRCIVENNQHQNRIMKALNIHDRDACYSQRAKP